MSTNAGFEGIAEDYLQGGKVRLIEKRDFAGGRRHHLSDGRTGNAELREQPREPDRVPDSTRILIPVIVANCVNADLCLFGGIPLLANQEDERASGIAFLRYEGRKPLLACQSRNAEALVKRPPGGIEIQSGDSSLVAKIGTKLHVVAGLDISTYFQHITGAPCNS